MAEELQWPAAEGGVGRPMASPAVASLGAQWQGEEERVLCTPLTASGASGAEVARVGTGKGPTLPMIPHF